MIQRNALIAAAAVTAFVLVLAGGVAARIGLASASPAAVPAAVAADPAAGSAQQQRDAAYQQLIQEANQRLQQAYAQQQQAVQQATAPAPAPAAPAPAYPVTPEQAGALALQAVPGARLDHTPELVSFQGTPAYEVTLDRGKVYVDVTSGAVLYNGAVPADGPVTAEQAAAIAQSYLAAGGENASVAFVRPVEGEHDRRLYQVNFTSGRQVYVDARTGQVVYAQFEDEHDNGG